MEAGGQTVVAGFVVLQDRLVRPSHPDAVAAMVGLVTAIGVARALGLEAIVVGIQGVVPLEDVAATGPASILADKHAVAAVRNVVVGVVVVVRAGLDHHAGRITGVGLAGPDADAPTEIVLQGLVAAGGK